MPKKSFFRLRKAYQDVLIQMAADVFNSKDYQSLKVSDFCKGMDLPTGTFYEYFENKEDLCVYLASLAYGKKFAALGKDNVVLFSYEKEGFSLMSPEIEEIGGITYDKILHCGVGFFARLFDEYLLDMMMPYNKEGLQEKINAGIYREDMDVEMASYMIALLSTFSLHYFDRYKINDEEKQEEIIMKLITAVDELLKKNKGGI